MSDPALAGLTLTLGAVDDREPVYAAAALAAERTRALIHLTRVTKT